VVELSRGSLELADADGGGTVAVVSFPLLDGDQHVA
jgi:hypothetical protein